MAQISLDAALQKIKNYPAAQPGATDAVDTAEAVMKSKVLSIPAAILSAVCIAAAIVAGAYTGLCAYVANSDAIWPGVTVLGQDQVGIIAAVCTLLAQQNVNILDISQTILQGAFTMVMAVDLSAAKLSFTDLARKLEDLGKSMDLSIRIQREGIFDAMHRI